MTDISNHINQEMIEELREIMEDDFDELISTYVEDSKARIIELGSAFNVLNHIEIRDAAHTLKGSSANLGAMALSEFCAELEDLAKQEDSADAVGIIEKITTEFSSVSSILNTFI